MRRSSAGKRNAGPPLARTRPSPLTLAGRRGGAIGLWSNRGRFWRDDADVEVTVGVPGVAAAVAPLTHLVEAALDVELGQLAGAPQVVEEVVALGVDVGADVVRHLSRGVAQADRAVIRRRADPHRAAVRRGDAGAPEADVVAPPRVAADGLLECQVFLAA